MDFDLSAGARRACRPRSAGWRRTRSGPGPGRSTRAGEYPQDLFEVFRDAGLLGLCIPEAYGGSGAGILGLTIAIEEVAKYSNTAALMLLLTRLPTGPVHDRRHRGAEAALPARHRRGHAAAAAFGLSEPQAGSDVMGMRTRAVPDPDRAGGWVLNGHQVLDVGRARGRLVHRVRQDRRADQPGPRLGDGLHRRARLARGGGRPHRPQDGCARRRHRRAPARRGARARRERHRRGGRLPAGHARAQLDAAHRRRPRASGWPRARSCTPPSTSSSAPRSAQTIADFQGIQWEIAKCAVDIEAARLLTYRAAWLADQGKFTKEWVPYLSMAKYHATELAVRASGLAVQLLGAAGYMEDHPTEQWYRDAKQLTIVEGTSARCSSA